MPVPVLSRRDLDFLLYDWLDVVSLTDRPYFAEHSRETFDGILDLSADLAAKHFATHNKKSDATEPRIGEHGALTIEFIADHVNERPEWIDAVNILGRANLFYNYTLGRRIVFSAGPSFNVLTSDWRDPETGAFLSSIAPVSPLFTDQNGDVRIQGWIGFRAGVGLRF